MAKRTLVEWLTRRAPKGMLEIGISRVHLVIRQCLANMSRREPEERAELLRYSKEVIEFEQKKLESHDKLERTTRKKPAGS